MKSIKSNLTSAVPTKDLPPAPITPAERLAVKRHVAGVAFICQINDTEQLVDCALDALTKIRSGGALAEKP